MRTISLVALLLAGCSCSDPVDPFEDGSVPLDGTALDGGDGALADGDLAPDAGRRDCAEYARVLCASFERCYLEAIWFYGSVERCEAHLRGECEYDRAFEDVGDHATARLECFEESEDCELYRSFECPLPAGTRGEGAPCGSSRQCAAGLVCATPSDLPHSCEAGTCRVPLAEGADCYPREDGNYCGGTLQCIELEGESRCVPYEKPAAGAPCGRSFECAQGLYCSSGMTCEPVLANGSACDPSEPVMNFVGPCGGEWTFECDPDTRTCVQFERAFVGDACVVNGSPRCMGDCVEGVCAPLEWYAFGEPCEHDYHCITDACVDGVCGVEPCE